MSECTNGRAHLARRWTSAARTAAFGGVIVVTLVGCTPTAQPSPSPTPIAVAETPSPTPTPTPTPIAGTLTQSQVTDIEQAISTGVYSGLGRYLGNPVHVTFAASDFSKNRAPASVIADLAFISGTTNWNWSVDPATLATWRTGHYAALLPADAIIGQAAEGDVISITVVGQQITKIFVCAQAELLNQP